MASSPVTQSSGSLTAESPPGPAVAGLVAPMTSSFEGVFDSLMPVPYPIAARPARTLDTLLQAARSAGEGHGLGDVAAQHVAAVEQVVLPHQPGRGIPLLGQLPLRPAHVARRERQQGLTCHAVGSVRRGDPPG